MRERKHLTVKVSETNKCTRNPCEIFGHSMKRQKKKGEKRTREEKERIILKSFKNFQIIEKTNYQVPVPSTFDRLDWNLACSKSIWIWTSNYAWKKARMRFNLWLSGITYFPRSVASCIWREKEWRRRERDHRIMAMELSVTLTPIIRSI